MDGCGHPGQGLAIKLVTILHAPKLIRHENEDTS